MVTTNHYFLKGDISGIQDFIFNVKSEKAARVLKRRSFFVAFLSQYAKLLLEKYLKQQLGDSSTIEKFYDGGGGFYLELSCEANIDKVYDHLRTLELRLNQQLQKEDIYISFSAVEVQDLEGDFKKYWKRIASQTIQDKLRPFNFSASAFEPYAFEDSEFEDDFNKASRINPAQLAQSIFNKLNAGNEDIGVQFEDIKLSDFQVDLPIWKEDMKEDPNYALPKLWEYNSKVSRMRGDKEKATTPKPNDIIDFSSLAYFANIRTGTNKLAVLKLDVDNLGSLFNEILDRKTAKKVSTEISRFFGEEMNRLLQLPKNYYAPDSAAKENKYFAKQHIYTIFSGGDDCIFVGGWDEILDWALLIQEQFQATAQAIQKLVPSSVLPTISAGVVVLEPTYPVVRFANLVEEALNASKGFVYPMDEVDEETNRQIPTKNRITVFGETLAWEEFKEAKKIAMVLQTLVEEENESKSTIQRIQQSAARFKAQHEQVLEGKLVAPRISNLFYFVRNTKNEDIISKSLIQPYTQRLMRAFTQKEKTNPMLYPVAARWAELLTRGTKTKKHGQLQEK